jgi:hypothetical protein
VNGRGEGRPEVRAEVGHRTVWLFGRPDIIVPAIKLVRSPRQFDDRRRAWQVPVAFSSDVLAAIEDRVGGDGVSVVEVDR